MMKINIVMKNPPGPDSDFVEVEDENGVSMKLGEWVQQGEFWALSFDTKDLEDLDTEMDEYLEQVRVDNVCVFSP